jgi:putative transposase
MIDRGHELPLSRQAAVLGISRGSLYYSACPVPAAELAIMRRIDELHLDYPFAGSRMLRDLLRGEGIAIGRDPVTTMMRRIAIEAVYRRPHTSKPADGHKAFPYLLRGMAIERVNQVWAMDITYIPMVHGFVYLAAVMDWFSRRVLSWRVSITMDVDFCLDCLGRGSWRDNVLVERLWRSVKYEEVYLRAYDSVSAALTACRRHAARCTGELAALISVEDFRPTIASSAASFTGLLSDNAIRISRDGMLPHSAPSVAICVGSGVTVSAVKPSRSRCACQADGSAKCLHASGSPGSAPPAARAD